MMKHSSIEQQIRRNSLFVIGTALVLTAMVVNFTTTSWLKQEYDNNLRTKANVLVTLVKESPQGIEFDFADEFMPEFERSVNPEYFQIWDHDRQAFEKSNSLREKELPYHAPDGTDSHTRDLVLADGRKGRMIQLYFTPQVPTKIRHEYTIPHRPPMALAIARERESLDRLLLTIHASAIFGTIIILALVGVFLRRAVRSGLQPLTSIEEQVKLLDADNLNARLVVESPPVELDHVILQINKLLDRLELTIEQSRQFSSDVAHELRTPIAELKSLAEVALKWPNDVEMAQEFYQEIYDTGEQMQNLVNNLLTLTRCENGEVSLHPKEIQLSEFIREAWTSFESQASVKNISLHCQVSSDMTIITSVIEFEQIINNLLSNAVHYSPAGSVISIQTSVHNQSLRLDISNTVEDLDTEDLDLMFDRLWRKSTSRSPGMHCGLGLSLVKAYSALIGLKVSVELSDEHELTMHLHALHLV